MKTTWLISAALFACGSSEPPVMYATVTSAGMVVDVDRAAEQIGIEHCSRERSCGDACEVDVDRRVHDLLGRSCSSVDLARLSSCREEIREQTCLETGQFPFSCEGVRLCR